MNGFIKLHRKLLEWGWYSDSAAKDVFIHLLLTAAYREKTWRDITIKKGQVVVSNKSLADKLGFSVQQIRTAINKLKSTGEITIKSTNKFSIITIVKWEDYQIDEDLLTSSLTSKSTDEQQTNNKQITNNQQTNNKQITTTEEYKEYKNINNINNNKINVMFDNMRARLREKMSITSFNCWFNTLELLSADDSEIVLGVDKKLIAKTIQSEFWDKLTLAVSETFGISNVRLIWRNE